MASFAQDLRVTLRGLRRSPTLVITAVLVLALGIGMAIAMFTVVDSILLRPLPVRDQASLVVMWTYHDPAVEAATSRTALDRVRRVSRTMTAIAAVAHYGAVPYPVVDGDRTLELNRAQVSSDFFDVLGAHPALGRLLRPDDDRKGAPPVIVISYAAWRSRFGGDSTVIGRRVHDVYEEATPEIVGVAAPGLDYPLSVDYWRPIGDADPSTLAVARLAPGATLADARAELLSLSKQFAPNLNMRGVHASTLETAIVGDVHPALVAVAIAVSLLLLLACVNVGSLLLLRVASRSREFALRRALGASAGSIAHLVLWEGGMLVAGGTAGGLLIARGLIRVLLAFAPARMPSTEVLQLAGIPAPIVLAVTLFALLALVAAPTLVATGTVSASRTELGDRSRSDTRSHTRTRRLLVALQVTIALTMLAGAGLIVRTVSQLQRIDVGYRPTHLAVTTVSLPPLSYDWSGPKMLALGEQIMRAWRALPGVEAATPIALGPFYGPNVLQGPVTIEGRTDLDGSAQPWVPMEEGDADYFHTLGVRLIQGRGFLDSDRENAMQVAVVSEAIARRYWPNESPIGKRIRFWQQDSTGWRTIVGVAGDIRWRSLRDATPTIYIPWRQGYWQGGFAIRSSQAFSALEPELRRAAREIDHRLDLWQSKSMQMELSGPLAQPRFNAYLLSGFALVAMLLAALGLYGAIASNVRAQSRDIGVKMALGASASRVRREVLRTALETFVPGACVGLVAALALGRLMTGLLYEVSPADPVALLGACALLALVALAAALIPARRAARIDPAKVLRAE